MFKNGPVFLAHPVRYQYTMSLICIICMHYLNAKRKMSNVRRTRSIWEYYDQNVACVHQPFTVVQRLTETLVLRRRKENRSNSAKYLKFGIFQGPFSITETNHVLHEATHCSLCAEYLNNKCQLAVSVRKQPLFIIITTKNQAVVQQKSHQRHRGVQNRMKMSDSGFLKT